MDTKKELFVIPGIVDDETPMIQDPFYTWLKAKGTKQQFRTDSICEYLDSLGFVTGKDTISEGNWQTLCYVYDCYYNMWTSTDQTFKLNELFIDTGSKDRSETQGHLEYHVRDLDNLQQLSPMLIELLEHINMIYPTAPNHYYFETINGYLFIKYQTIIGSRRICKVAL